MNNGTEEQQASDGHSKTGKENYDHAEKYHSTVINLLKILIAVACSLVIFVLAAAGNSMYQIWNRDEKQIQMIGDAINAIKTENSRLVTQLFELREKIVRVQESMPQMQSALSDIFRELDEKLVLRYDSKVSKLVEYSDNLLENLTETKDQMSDQLADQSETIRMSITEYSNESLDRTEEYYSSRHDLAEQKFDELLDSMDEHFGKSADQLRILSSTLDEKMVTITQRSIEAIATFQNQEERLRRAVDRLAESAVDDRFQSVSAPLRRHLQRNSDSIENVIRQVDQIKEALGIAMVNESSHDEALFIVTTKSAIMNSLDFDDGAIVCGRIPLEVEIEKLRNEEKIDAQIIYRPTSEQVSIELLNVGNCDGVITTLNFLRANPVFIIEPILDDRLRMIRPSRADDAE